MTHAKNLFAVVAVWVIGFASGHAVSAQAEWKAELARELPVLGHRNWVVVADSAYPSQTAPGIKTIYTGGEQIEVVRAVLAAVDRNEHVRGTLFLDAELPYVPEEFAPGIDAYRRQLPQAMDGRKATSRPHDEIIAELDEAGKTFRVLVLKTNLTLPYTTVFIRLDCGYWSDDAERALREAIRKGAKSKPPKGQTR